MSRLRALPRPVRVGIVAVLVLSVLGTLSVLGYLEVMRNQEVVLPRPTGSYPVGRASYDWIDDGRVDELAPAKGAKRELLVWVWYPAVPPPPGVAPASYLPEDWIRALERDRGVVGSQLFQNLAAVRTHSTVDAPLSTARSSYPVLIFMPGYGDVVSNYTTIGEDLASHGYVVVGINPTYTTTVVFPDGRETARTPAGTIPEASGLDIKAVADTLVEVWAADARFVLDRLGQLDVESNERFSGHLDLSRTGVFGHSFGGAAALETCRQDSRCRAAIDLDGTPFGEVAKLGLDQPTMFVWAEGGEPRTQPRS